LTNTKINGIIEKNRVSSDIKLMLKIMGHLKKAAKKVFFRSPASNMQLYMALYRNEKKCLK